MTRLSTGKRINSAQDDDPELSGANRMEAEINGLAITKKCNDAHSYVGYW